MKTSKDRSLLYSDEFKRLLEKGLREMRVDEVTLKQIQQKQEKIKILKSVNCRCWYWGCRKTEKLDLLTIYFKCLDSKGTGRKHLVRVTLEDFPEYLIKYKDLKPEEILKKSLVEGNVRVHCTCESWSYGGYAYLSTLRDYQIVKELRPPNKTNPTLKGSICKHVSTVANRIPLFLRSVMLDLNKKNFKKSVRIKTGDKVYVI